MADHYKQYIQFAVLKLDFELVQYISVEHLYFSRYTQTLVRKVCSEVVTVSVMVHQHSTAVQCCVISMDSVSICLSFPHVLR